MTICEADILDTYGAATEVLVTPTNDSDNGVVVKRPNSTWGVDQPYGSGQAFMLVRDGDRSDPGPDGAVLARMDHSGSIGTNGVLHLAVGLRETVEGAQVGEWLDLHQDVVALFINNLSSTEGSSTRDFICVLDQRDGTYPFRVVNSGSIVGAKDTTARDGSTYRTAIGNTYGVAGVAMGQAADTTVYRKAAGIVGLGNAFYFRKVTSEPAAIADGVLGYSILNAQGKMQAKLKFPSGATVVLGTDV